MDRISLLSDDVILKILSFAPTKVAVTTSLLSKRWSDLWKHVARLEYCDPKRDTEQWRASSFVHNFLLLHKVPVLETLHLRLSRNCRPTYIKTWIRIAVARGVRDLLFHQYFPSLRPIWLPRSLYTCESLVTLSLQYAIIVDVPLTMCFRSLRALLPAFVNFSSDETVHRLLSGCPVLEDLKVIRRGNDNVKTFTIMVPSLQRLQVLDLKFGYQVPGDDFESVIKAPFFKVVDDY